MLPAPEQLSSFLKQTACSNETAANAMAFLLKLEQADAFLEGNTILKEAAAAQGKLQEIEQAREGLAASLATLLDAVGGTTVVDTSEPATQPQIPCNES